jgi:hypothetical protein
MFFTLASSLLWFALPHQSGYLFFNEVRIVAEFMVFGKEAGTAITSHFQ